MTNSTTSVIRFLNWEGVRMDPITHAVIGAAIAKLTGNEISISDAATVSMVIGAVLPDADIVFQKWGDYAYLKNHRGLTHSIIGLVVSSAVLAGILSFFYESSSVLGLFLWSLLGGLSHSGADLLNSYGAKLFWPFFKKGFSLGIINSFDPVFFVSLIGYILSPQILKNAALVAIISYIALRVLMKCIVSKDLKRRFSEKCGKVSLLPSVTGLFRWHFILEEPDRNTVGEKSIFKRNIKIFQVFDKIEDEVLKKVSFSYVGKFFSEFTPVPHVMRENVDNIDRYVFVDMRYYFKNSFLHHAVLELDKDDNIINASFNPYSMKRSSSIPNPDLRTNTTLFARLVGM